jgi:hypothetical protein
MNNWEKVLLIGVGLVAGVVVTLAIFRPKTQAITYVARTYTNMEEWEFIKDLDGRVRGVRVKRNAREN